MHLRELRDDELPAFLTAAQRFYVHDLIHSGGVTEEDARAKARRDHDALFPHGRRQPGHHVLAVEDDSGTPVGRMWFAERGPTIWLYQVEIDEAHRGAGLGRAAMEALEARARELGATKLELNVFGRNAVARGLYRSLGFAEEAVHMGKPL